MHDYLETWGSSGSRLIPLSGDRLTIGKGSEADVSLGDDRTVSRLHALIERLRGGWCLRDLGSRNGTFVNGERIMSDRALRPGDEIRIGRARLVFRAGTGMDSDTATEALHGPPDVTPREKDLLVELCRTALSEHLLSEPATVAEMAQRLVVTESAVKKHLMRLYAKFGIPEGARRRGRLATEAIRTGAVTLADLRVRRG